jgi:hypothetical protein
VRLSSSRKHLSRAVEVPLNGPSYSAACAGSREQSRPTYAVNAAGRQCTSPAEKSAGRITSGQWERVYLPSNKLPGMCF